MKRFYQLVSICLLLMALGCDEEELEKRHKKVDFWREATSGQKYVKLQDGRVLYCRVIPNYHTPPDLDCSGEYIFGASNFTVSNTPLVQVSIEKSRFDFCIGALKLLDNLEKDN